MVIFTEAAGYAFAISYQSDVSKVTRENLVIFTTNRKYGTALILRSFTDSCGTELPIIE